MEGNKLVNMIRENVLFEDLKNDVYRMIVESHGISDEITEFLYANKKQILDTVKYSIGGGEIDDNGIEKSVVSINIPSFIKTFLNKEGKVKISKHNILFTFYVFNFSSKEQYDKYKKQYGLNDGYTNSDGTHYDWITIHTYTINGKVKQPELFDTIGHELSHVYKQDMAWKTIPKNNKQYLNSFSRLTSNNKIESAIAQIIYYSEKFEQEGYANGLYYYLKEKGVVVLTWNDIKKCEVWKHYQNLYNSIVLVNENKEEAQEILNKFYNSKKVDSILRIGRNGLVAFKNRLLNVITKMHEDKLNEGIMCTSTHYYEHFII